MTEKEKINAIDIVKQMVTDGQVSQEVAEKYFPELKESEDERIRKVLIGWFNRYKEEGTCGSETFNGIPTDNIIAWLEKQVPVDEDEIVKGIRRGVAISLMNHIDANSKGMCLSNMECEDIENAIVNEDWDKVYGYMKKKLEKQGEKAQGKTALEAWKDMRFEVYQQASGNRHEPNCSDDATKMFSLTDIDEIFEKIAEKQGEQKPFDYENANIQQKDFAPKETVKEAESNLTPLERKVKDILFSFHINAADGISFDGTMAIVHNLITLCQQEQKHAEKKELKKIEDKHICELDNSYTCVKFPFKAKVKSYGKIVTIQGGQLSPDGREWRKYQSDAEDGYKVYEPNNLELVCEIKQKPAEWSEEDEKNTNSIIDAIKSVYCTEALDGTYDFEKIFAWLKSLKDRIYWKPSEEQIYWLKWTINRMPDTEKANEAETVLKDLLEYLEKL